MDIQSPPMNDDDKQQRNIRLNAIFLGLVAFGFFALFIALVAIRG